MAPTFTPWVTGLRCLRCGQTYAPGALDYVCPCGPNTGSDLGTLDVLYDYAAMAAQTSPQALLADPDPSIGRWQPLLPVDRRRLPPLPVGGTPLLAAPRLAQALDLAHLAVKDDGRNPSASFKDRASAIAVARAQAEGRGVIATASTGNAAAALAALAAAAGHPTVIFVPKTAPRAKIAQLLAYGSRVLAVDGSYDDAFDLCVAACQAFGWYNRNTGYNPYMTEGKKTVSFEIAAQWTQQVRPDFQDGLQVPDAVFVSVGDGCIIGGVYKGFWELHRLGWIERIPRLYGVQSTRSPALARAWQAGLDVPEPVHATTRADSISVDAPRDARKALRAVRESGGAFVLVEDEAILQAIPDLAQGVGVFAEPAGAAAYAGLVQARRQGLIQGDERVVVINTGSGLKDVNAAMEATGAPTVIPPTLEAVQEVMRREG